jgi:Putative protein-S-isoprenylcysteine methyltransferase
LFVVLYEEPTLRRSFGDEYNEYCSRVKRWSVRTKGKAPPEQPVAEKEG